MRKKWTYKEFAEFLATQLMNILEKFIEKRLPEWIYESFVKIKTKNLLKEWSIFETFIMANTLLNIFKSNKYKYQMLDAFHEKINNRLVEINIFKSQSEFNKLLRERYATYSKALGNKKSPGPLHWLSKSFCKYCKNEYDIPSIVATASYFIDISKSHKTFIDNLLKDHIDIVE